MLLLEAVSAAVPTVAMPPTVRAAVDSIRTGMGMPPLQWTSSAPLARALELGDSHGITMASLSQCQSLPPRGDNLDGHPPPPSGAQMRGLDKSSRGRVSVDGWVGTGVCDKGSNGRARASGDGDMIYAEAIREAKISGSTELIPRRHYCVGGDDGSYSGSEGSGIRYPPVMPNDDSEEEEREGARPMQTRISLSAQTCTVPL